MTDILNNGADQSLRARRNRILFGSLAALALFFAVLAVVVLSIGSHFDREVRQQETSRLTDVIGQLARDHQRDLVGMVGSLKSTHGLIASDIEQMNHFLDGSLMEAMNHQHLIIVNSMGEPVWVRSSIPMGDLSWWHALPAELRAEMTGQDGRDSNGTSRIVNFAGRPAVISVVEVPKSESINLSYAKAIALRILDAETIRFAGRLSGIERIELQTTSATSDGMAVLGLTVGGEQPAFWLAWTPNKPSERIQLVLLPAFGVGVLVLFIIMMVTRRQLRGSDDKLIESRKEASKLAEKAERLEHFARQLAYTDAVSGLANRRDFIDRLTEFLEDRAAIENGVVAVFHLDIDRFTEINDSLGHHAGDDVVRAVGERLRGALSPIDLLARIGDDEFAIARAGLTSATEAEIFLTQFIDIFSTPMEVAEMPMLVTCSIGAALAPFHGDDALTIMRHADVALNAGKTRGRKQWTIFSDEMVEDARLGLVLETDLRHAINNDALTLQYQPQFDAKGTRIIGVEALLRWRHPERGFISPMVFVPIAEDRGLAPELGEWVMRRALTDAKRWPDLSVAINVSPAEFADPGFLPRVARMIEESGLDPSRIELEVTEGVMIQNGEDAGETIKALRNLGVKTALDDFGTGFSSLSYLRRFNFDRLKIDKSFIQEIETSDEATAIVQAIITMAHALNMRLVAEGVETTLQHRFLQASGCDYLQGWLFAKAMEADAVSALLKAKGRNVAVAA